MTIVEAAAALRARRISCVELTTQCLDNIAAHNPKLNAFITVTGDSALAQARLLDDELSHQGPRGPLHGIPVAHKDLLYTKGIKTTGGSLLFADFVPDHDAEVVQKLAAAGAVMLGKTGLHEIAYGITSANPHFGVIRNPRDPDRIPGGSSGGSAAAIGAGMALMATGTDTGGSIRIPASFCGIVGLKPTYGAVSRRGVLPLGLSLDHIGPMTQTVADAALMFASMRGNTAPSGAPFTMNGVRVGLPLNFYFNRVDPAVADAVRAVAAKCEQMGAALIETSVPDIQALNTVARVILLAEASAVYQKHWDKRDKFGPDVLTLIDQGRLIPATDYVFAQRLRKTFCADFRRLFQGIDFLLTPATPTPAPLIGETTTLIDGTPEDVRLAATRLVRGVNAIGYPALAMPCGKTDAGLQIIGRPNEDDRLLDFGAAIEGV